MIGSITTSTDTCVHAKSSQNHAEYLLRFADHDLLMRYHWSLGVGHAYAYRTTEPAEETPHDSGFDGEAALNAPHQSEPDIFVPDRDHMDGDGDGDGDDDDDGDSNCSRSAADLDDSGLDTFDVEIAAMYDWESQDEGEEEYKF